MATARHSRCHVIGCDLHLDAKPTQCPKKLQLHDVFLQLMTLDRHDDERSPITDTKRAKHPCHICDLPRPELHRCIRMLTAKDVAALSGVCSLFRRATYEVVPGLKLQLFSHQQTVLQWLLHCEGSSRRLEHVPHPFFFPSLQHGEDTDASRIDLIDGRLVTFPLTPRAADTRGGLFCDEPGLGKTITMLAMLLRTEGQRSDPRDLQDERPSTRTTRVSPRFAAYGRAVDTRDLLPSTATLPSTQSSSRSC